MKQPTMILLDIGNVVLFARHALSFDFLDQYGVARDTAALMYADPQYREFNVGITDELGYTRALNKCFGTDLSLNEMRRALDVHIHSVNKPLMAELKKCNPAHIAIVTDTNPWQTIREYELIGARTYATAGEFRSHKMGLLKSDPEFFTHVLQKLQTEADSCLLIDDSPAKIATAAQCGIRTHLFEDTFQTISFLQKLRLDEQV